MVRIYLNDKLVATFSNRAAAESFLRRVDPLYCSDYVLV
jgi:hypothetical protein